MSDKPDFDIAERQYAEIRDLTAKLKAAEEALAADDPSSHIIEWKSRAEAAEARADAMERAGAEQACRADQNQTDMLGWRSRAEAAEAEVARLREAWEKRGEHMQNWERDYFRVCKERDAALAESNNLIVKVQFAEAVIRDEKQIERTATEAALRHIAKTVMGYKDDYVTDHWVKRHLSAVCGEVKP